MPSFSQGFDTSKGTFRFQNSLGQFSKISNTVFLRALEAGRVAGSAAAKAAAPVGNHGQGRKAGGTLKKSIRATTRGSSVVISTNVPYAQTIEEGSGELEIGPALMRFYWVNRGRMFTGPATKMYPDNTYVGRNWPAIVRRPPFKPQPYLKPGLQAAADEITRYSIANIRAGK
jgi:hypothetical protein